MYFMHLYKLIFITVSVLLLQVIVTLYNGYLYKTWN